AGESSTVPRAFHPASHGSPRWEEQRVTDYGIAMNGTCGTERTLQSRYGSMTSWFSVRRRPCLPVARTSLLLATTKTLLRVRVRPLGTPTTTTWPSVRPAVLVVRTELPLQGSPHHRISGFNSFGPTARFMGIKAIPMGRALGLTFLLVVISAGFPSTGHT